MWIECIAFGRKDTDTSQCYGTDDCHNESSIQESVIVGRNVPQEDAMNGKVCWDKEDRSKDDSNIEDVWIG